MYAIISSRDFKKSLEKLRRSGKFNESLLEKILTLLVSGEILPTKYKDHQLQGDLAHLRQCHIKGDLLLQYKRNEDMKAIILDDIGTHHQILGR